ncbi:MAG: ATP-binding protein [Verrucomicrobiota bacterium]
MIDASSLALPGSPASADAGVAAKATAPLAIKTKGRTVLWCAIMSVSFASAIWIFAEATAILRATESSLSAAMLQELRQWRWVAPASVLGGGLFLGLLVNLVFYLVQKSWTKHLETIRSEAAIVTDHLRIQIAEKAAAEDHLLKKRNALEAQVVALTNSNEEMREELDRRMRSERSMAVQSQSLAASKDVLQMHVQVRSQEVQKLQRQCESILNAAGEGICGIDAGGKITFANPTAARLMGLEIDKMVGRKEADLFGATTSVETEVVTKKTAGKPVEITLTRGDNSTFTAEFMRSQILENDQVVGRVVLLKDITERKEAAEALERKASELARSNAELEQFAFVASHDLQEPLRKIRAFGDRLKMKCDTVLPAEGADYLGRMQNAAARMQTLIADLLTFSRVISRTDPFVEVDLAQVTREVLSDLEVRIEKVGATVTVGELPKIQADPMQMRQLFQNLIGNALKFQLPEVKPQVQIAARLVAPDEYSSQTGPMCELTVQDNGIGFDEKYLEKIFAVFQRLHNRQEYEGTGIGLAVCRRIVDRHGGSITARSKPGAGATFVVQLPVKTTTKAK